MKNIIKLFIPALLLVNQLTAQSPIINKDTRPIVTPQTVKTDIAELTLYEQPNFAGEQSKFTLTNGKLSAPFKRMDKVSFKVAPGKIAYIGLECGKEFPSEKAYTGDNRIVNLENVCSIRIDNAVSLPIEFKGISTIIHNNDCKRVFGEISVRIIEKAPRSGSHTFMSHRAEPAFSIDGGIFVPFTHPNSTQPLSYTNFLYDASRPFTVSNEPKLRSLPVKTEFIVGATALAEGRVVMEVKTRIGSAHKTCDLCDDFSSNVVMKTAITETIPLNRTSQSNIVLGPYKAEGKRDGNSLTASGGIFIDFSVYFKVIRP